MIKLFQTILFTGLFVLMAFVVSPVHAETDAKAQKFVQTLGDEAIALLDVEGQTEEEFQKDFSRLLTRYFDIKTIGRFTLGKNWRIATEEQQDEFLDLFKKMVVSIYSNKFQDYTNEKFNVINAVVKNKRDSIVTSQIEFTNERPPIRLEWRVRTGRSGQKIIDLSIEGVSMSITQRSDFASVITRGGGIEALLERMRKQYN